MNRSLPIAALVDLRRQPMEDVLERVEEALRVRLDREALVRKRRSLGAVRNGVRGCVSSGGDSSGSARRAGTGPRQLPFCKGSRCPSGTGAWRGASRANR